MRSTLMVALLLLPTVAMGQSLSDVAKKERQRRERNKKEGKDALVISEQDLSPGGGSASSDDTVSSSSTPAGASSRVGSRSSEPRRNEEGEYDEEGEYSEERTPTTIAADLPLEDKLRLFEEMKRAYNRQVAEIDDAIAENTERIRQLDAKIGATSALGGAGLPVAPQTGTGAVNTQMTGQESQTLVAERDRLTAMNAQMTSRKEQLKTDLQTKGRVAGIPPGYLRF